MSSIQERLQMKRVPLDTWSSREQLCLASSVVRSGDQNWMSVSRALKSLGDPSRPADWFSQKSCAAQYGTLLEHVETPKRKKRTADGAAETPQESIVKKLTQERIAEIQKVMVDLSQQYQILKEEINEVRSPTTSAARLREMCATMEADRRQREREQARHQQWLREREERKARADKAWRPVTGAPVPSTSTSPASSPLLTSLLKSTGTSSTAQITQPPLTQVLHIPHPSTVVDTVSPSAGAPTLSMLLEKPSGTHTQSAVIAPMPSIPDTNKNAVIEQIKNQLQEIEHQLKGGTITTPQPTLVAAPVVNQEEPPPSSIEEPVKTPDKIDIDDIEIKAEDVYAFSDIDLEIPPVSTIHKTPLSRTLDKTLFNKKDNNATLGTSLDDLPEPHDFSNMSSGRQSCEEDTAELQPKVEPVSEGEGKEAKDNAKTEADNKYKPGEVEKVAQEQIEPACPIKDDVTKMSTFDSDIEIKEEPVDLMPTIALADIPPPEDREGPTIHEQNDLNEDSNPPDVSEESKADEESDSADAQQDLEESVCDKETRVPMTTCDGFKADTKNEIADEDKDEEDNAKSEIMDHKKEEPSAEPATEPPETEERLDEVISIGKEDKEDSKEITSEEPATESQTETDDDTPMEVIREEDKLGRTKRDYSRRRLEPTECGEGGPRADFSDEAGSDNSSHALTEKKIGRPKISTSRSESPATPMDSLPGSPATPTTPALPAPPPAVPAAPPHDPDRDHRLWKKSVMLVYSRLCAHKYASLFLRPITDDQAPGYSLVVKRPMDLTTIKKNIDAGVIRSTAEFQREVLLMLVNALMYNSSWHRVHAMARDMMREASAQLGMLLQAQAHAALEPSTRRAPVKRKRTTHTPPSVHHKKRRTHE